MRVGAPSRARRWGGAHGSCAPNRPGVMVRHPRRPGPRPTAQARRIRRSRKVLVTSKHRSVVSRSMRPHIFFDDQMTHLERARSFVPSAHVLGEFEQEQLFRDATAAVEAPRERGPRIESEPESRPASISATATRRPIPRAPQPVRLGARSAVSVGALTCSAAMRLPTTARLSKHAAHVPARRPGLCRPGPSTFAPRPRGLCEHPAPVDAGRSCRVAYRRARRPSRTGSVRRVHPGGARGSAKRASTGEALALRGHPRRR